MTKKPSLNERFIKTRWTPYIALVIVLINCLILCFFPELLLQPATWVYIVMQGVGLVFASLSDNSFIQAEKALKELCQDDEEKEQAAP